MALSDPELSSQVLPVKSKLGQTYLWICLINTGMLLKLHLLRKYWPQGVWPWKLEMRSTKLIVFGELSDEFIITEWKVWDKSSTLWPPPAPPSNLIRVSLQGCRWREPRLLLTAARWHTGVWWSRSPGRGCAAPWRWCGCSHKWRRQGSTPPTQHPPRPSQWGRPSRAPPAAGCWPQTMLICPAALRKKRAVEEKAAFGNSQFQRLQLQLNNLMYIATLFIWKTVKTYKNTPRKLFD